jgi:acetolactate synthase-1/2/3 large subunit
MGEAVEALGDALQGFRSTWDLPAMKALQHDETERLKKDSPGFAVMSCIRSCIPDDACTVWDLNMIAYWAEYCFPVLEQRTFIAPRGISPIFYAVPAAIGAKIGRPERPCLCVVGDGGGLPGLAELATVQKYRIPVVFLVYNNSGFGILENYMRGRYAMENTMDLTNPDFVRLAEAFGVRAARAENLDELERVLRTEITWEEPFLVEFKYPVFPPPWYI